MQALFLCLLFLFGVLSVPGLAAARLSVEVDAGALRSAAGLSMCIRQALNVCL